MARKKNSAYTIEFKAEAVKLVKEECYSLSEAVRNLGVCKSTLRDWILKDQEDKAPASLAVGANSMED